jgi:hypothetical protein
LVGRFAEPGGGCTGGKLQAAASLADPGRGNCPLLASGDRLQEVAGAVASELGARSPGTERFVKMLTVEEPVPFIPSLVSPGGAAARRTRICEPSLEELLWQH